MSENCRLPWRLSPSTSEKKIFHVFFLFLRSSPCRQSASATADQVSMSKKTTKHAAVAQVCTCSAHLAMRWSGLVWTWARQVSHPTFHLGGWYVLHIQVRTSRLPRFRSSASFTCTQTWAARPYGSARSPWMNGAMPFPWGKSTSRIDMKYFKEQRGTGSEFSLNSCSLATSCLSISH